MTRAIGSGQDGERLLLNNASPWIWLFQVNIGSSEVAYLAAYDAQVTWNGQTYYPYPVEVPTVPESAEQRLATTTMTVYQVDGMLTDRIRDGELVGQQVWVRLVHADHLSETDIIEHQTTILAAEVVREKRAVQITIGSYNWLNRLLGQRFLRLRCRHVYGSEACGYDTNRTGALPTCSRLYEDGSNGCVEHGDDEENAGMFRYHPRRFGGFFALPRQNRG